jgi:hypothetical protein
MVPEVYGEVLSPKKRERCEDAPLCLALADRGKTALMLGRVNLLGCVQRRLVGEQHGLGMFRADCSRRDQLWPGSRN